MKRIIIDFLKDQRIFSIAYAVAFFLVVSFYSLETKRGVELAYPVFLVLAVYIVYMGIAFYQYYQGVKMIDSMAVHQETNHKPRTAFQQHIYNAMEQVHKSYGNEIYSQEEEHIEKKRFLSAWIHNMKTPVSVSRLLLERYDTGSIEKQEFLSQMQEEEQRTEKQLTMILTIMRLEEFVKDYTPDVISLKDEVRRIINEQRRLFIYNHVYPKVSGDDSLVLSDMKWNDALIEQIISNAIKYSTRKKESTLWITIKKDGTKVHLIIEDEGIGIPESDLGRVYEPFFTGENGRKVKGASGIGLYFCKEICDHLGHALAIESTEGKGTKVTISYLAKL